MPKKYRHIQLPRSFISQPQDYSPHSGRLIQELPKVDYKIQGITLKKGIDTLKDFMLEKDQNLVLPDDKSQNELNVKFYGIPNKNFFNKYNIQIYKKRDGHSVYGKISNRRLKQQQKSDFERLEEDIRNYSEENTLKSYFSSIEEIKPLNYEEIVDLHLKEYFQSHRDNLAYVDISFVDNYSFALKFSSLKETYNDKIVSKINSDFVHFCRLKLSEEDVKKITLNYSGIVSVGLAPFYDFEKSDFVQGIDDVTIVNSKSLTPIFVLDGNLNQNHKILKGSIEAFEGVGSGAVDHCTAVTSLAVCGSMISPKGNIIQNNKAIVIDVMNNKMLKTEEIIKDVVERYTKKYPLLLLNLSINDYTDQLYDRTSVHNFTVLLDELSWKYDCLFFISVGNLFKKWQVAMVEAAIKLGYPEYFSLPFTNILPPSDSINNISVGSLAYQSSPRSFARSKNPGPATRKNIDNNFFIKPDFVQYDSNLILNNAGKIEDELNGVFFAGSGDNDLGKGCGTSFATPLVLHDAGVLSNQYPNYSNNTIKGLLIHSTDVIEATHISDDNIRQKLIGFGMPNLDRALFSLGNSSTIVIEDEIGLNKTKKVKIPIPKSIKGSSKKRLRIRTTIVYNPPVNAADTYSYNPINISAILIRDDGTVLTSSTTKGKLSPAFPKSNVKKYTNEWSTKKHVGCFWELEVTSSGKIDDLIKIKNVSSSYLQKYSIILTVEDIDQDSDLDLHNEISQMIEIDIPIEV